MGETHTPTEDYHEPGMYEIRLKGHLEARRAYWFEGMTFAHESDGTTVLSGLVADQPALHGLLRKVRDLGLPLVSIVQVGSKRSNGPDVNASTNPNQLNKETNA